MKLLWTAALFLTELAGSAQASSLVSRQTATTAVVDFSVQRGTPQNLASGILYGIPDTPAGNWQIPQNFYTDIGLNFGRGGGSQVAGKGWIGGEADYAARMESAYRNYRHMRDIGGRFFLLLSALWGADGLQKGTDAFPGDNGNFARWDAFLVRVAADIRRLNMIDGCIVEIWNEADYNVGFWTDRQLPQFLSTWGWGYHRLRQLLPAGMQISGPAFATELSDGGPWPQWFQYARSNNSIPDMYTWHVLYQGGGVGNDIQWGRSQLNTLLTKYGLPQRPTSINEYAIPEGQNPGYSAWAISQLERYDTIGLRANWAMGGALHDYLASLVGKPDNTNGGTYSPTSGGYWTTGEWHLYKYYKQQQTGVRVSSTRSGNSLFDAFATLNTGSRRAAIIAGTNGVTGTYNLQLRGLSGITASTIQVVIKEYPWPGFRVRVDANQILTKSTTTYTVSNGQVTIPVPVTDAQSGYSLDITW